MLIGLTERLDRLEERFAWTQRHLTEQDRVILRLQEEVDRLRLELRLARQRETDAHSGAHAGLSAPDLGQAFHEQQQRAAAADVGEDLQDLPYERPPHY